MAASAMIRIGTRDSRLARWQATHVQQRLEAAGHACELVPVKSEGDLDTVTPLYAMGVQGVFTRTLDAALLAGRIDIAVHSMKDVPIQLAQGIAQAAVLERADPSDLLLVREGAGALDDSARPAVIGSSSIRRRAQWLHRHPHHRIEDLRGNVDTRLRKLADGGYDAIILAAAGLGRVGLMPSNAIRLDWMLPAPAQGAILIVARADDERALQATTPLNDARTALCAAIERDFLRALMGGCSSPIGALAEVVDGHVRLRGNVLGVDGRDRMEVELILPLAEAAGMGTAAAEELLQRGAKELLVKKDGCC